jgi:hypothetical protein
VSQLCELIYKGSIKRKSGLTILQGCREGGLYIYEELKPAALAATAPSSEKAILAHRRLGHLNYQQLKLLRHLSDGLELDNIPSDPCVPCLQAKMHRKHFSPSNHIASRPDELVHTDECQIGIPTINGGHKYYVSFTDDYSRFTVIYLLKKKSDAFGAFKQFDARVFNLTNRHITTLRSDGGGEFFNKKMQKYCQEHGIFQQKSQPSSVLKKNGNFIFSKSTNSRKM